MQTHYRNRYSKGLLASVIKESRSKAQVLTKLGLALHGGQYRSISRLIEEYKISTDHFKGLGWNRGQPSLHLHTEKSLRQTVFKLNGTHYTGARLRNWMVAIGVCKDRCAICGSPPVWRKKPITLEVDHINGNNRDNRLKNLRLLCPNCHTQTPNYGNKNKPSYHIAPAHGTYRRYKSIRYKCRCNKCSAANNAYNQKLREQQRKLTK